MENQDKYALSPSWVNGANYKEPFDHTIAGSGQIVHLRRLDMGDLLKLGIAEQMDLMSKALMAEDKPQSDQDAKETLSDVVLKSGNFDQMEKMINAVVVAGVIIPKIYAVPLHENARQKGLVYVDSVPFADRMELFSVIYEAEGLAMFRAEQTDGVGDVADVPVVPLPADRSVGVRPDDAEGVLLQPRRVPVGPDGGLQDERSGASESPGPTGERVDGPVSDDSAPRSLEQVPGS
jgi:hypothetical protein